MTRRTRPRTLGDQGGHSPMTSTFADLGDAFPGVEVHRTHHLSTAWAAYLPDQGAVLYSDRLTPSQEAAAATGVAAELSAAGVPRVPSPR